MHRALLGHRDALSLARVEGILTDAAGGFRVQLASGAGSGGEDSHAQKRAAARWIGGSSPSIMRLRLDMENLGDPGASRR